ncbi:MAG: Hsp20/alpha crystallin family protein [Rhodomicrobium sp.]
MAEASTKTPAKSQPQTSQAAARPRERDFFGNLRDEVERVFEDFDRGVWGLPARWRGVDLEPFRRPKLSFALTPSVDVAEKDEAFELTADLPGVDEKNIEVKLSGGVLTIKGEREEHKEEKKKDYYVSERQFGSFERSFQIPESVESDKIDARFKNGVLTILLPKKPGSQKAEKKISVRAG